MGPPAPGTTGGSKVCRSSLEPPGVATGVKPQVRGGMVYDPDDHDLSMVHGGVGVVRVEGETGNAYTISR